jgi:hypothetical protein
MKPITAVLALALSANAWSASGGSPPDLIVSHIVDGSGWSTNITLVNTGSVPAAFTINFYDASGKPLEIPALGNNYAGLGAQSVVNVQLPALGRWTFQSADLQIGVTTGWATIHQSVGTVSGGFTLSKGGRTATYPIGSASARFVLTFDAGAGATGLALTNSCPYSVPVAITFRDTSGRLLSADADPGMTAWLSQMSVISLTPGQDVQFTLPAYLTGRSGTVLFDAGSSGQCIAGLGLVDGPFAAVIPLQ